jgi:tagatose-1,6-bisphosphate aldolase
MRQISIGKYRGIQRASAAAGHFNILAIDHHDALRRALNSAAPETVTDPEMVAFKSQVIRALAPHVSAFLLDPLYSAGQSIIGGYLAQAGVLVELEQAGYAMQPLPLLTELWPGWNAGKIKRMGADGVKLFYYYNCDDAARAPQQDALLAQIAADCATYDTPFYAEPILYPLGDDEGEHQARFSERVITAAQRAEVLGADILKIEFPLHPSRWQDVTAMRNACEALTAATSVPWVLLSAGVDFERFCQQVEIACAAGASGVIAGRAVWGEAAQIADTDAREAWLQTTGRERMSKLAALVQAGTPWTARLSPDAVSTTWYQGYAGMSQS